jgi:hydrogenase-4 component F
MAEVWLVALLLLPPVAGAVVSLASGPQRPVAEAAYRLLPVVSLGAAVAIAWRLAHGGGPVALGLLWRLDALSAVLAAAVAAVAALATSAGPRSDGSAPSVARIRRFRLMQQVFVATMLVAVSTDNLGLMWVAIEATTVTSALLIPFERTKASVEASWKYLLLGSVGIALAFTGTVLAYVDYASAGGALETALDWTTLRGVAPRLHPEVVRLAFVFLLVGFGTKAGLAPMHTWLPDAHSEAPASLSALMSGVLLAVALYAIVRWKAIVDAAVGAGYTDTLLVAIAVASLAVGSLSLVIQRHYKRMLAYSSIEHVGLAAAGLALGAPGVFAALLHLVNHALGKSTAFLLAGRVLDRYRRHDIDGVSGLFHSVPATASLLTAAVLALAGLPPFGLFLSEVLLVRAGWLAGRPVLTGVMCMLLLVAFASVVHHVQRMLFGEPEPGVPRGETSVGPIVLLACPLIVLAWIGIAMPAGLERLLRQAADLVGP